MFISITDLIHIMFVRLKPHTFVRFTKDYVHIANLNNRRNLSYDQVGADWLRPLTNHFVDVTSIIHRLRNDNFYAEVEETILSADIKEFYIYLSELGLIEISDTKTTSLRECAYRNSFDDIEESTFLYPLNALVFELTDKFNERCIHCYIPNDTKNTAQFLPFCKFTKVIDEFAEMGGQYIRLTGGEIFLYPYLWKVLEYCKLIDIRVEILSNLISFDSSFVQRFKNLNVVSFQVSLYSLDPKIHDSITKVPGSFEKTKNAIETLACAGFDVCIGTPIMAENIHGFVDLLKYADSINVPVRIEQVLLAEENFSKENLRHRATLKDERQLLESIAQYSVGYYESQIRKQYTNDNCENFDFIKYLEQPVCDIAKDHLCITANGNITPCTGWQGLPLGNISNTKLKDLWHQNKILKKIRNIREYNFRRCISCEASDYCIRCLKRNFNESNGDMFNINPHYCDIAKLNKEIISNNKTYE